MNFFSLIGLVILSGIIFWFFNSVFAPILEKNKFNNKLTDINKSNVVFYKKNKIYCIPLSASSDKTILLHPIIDENCNRHKVYLKKIYISNEYIVDRDIDLIINIPQKSEFYAVNQISSVARDLQLNIEPQNLDLRANLAELKRLEKLATSSGMYKQQADLYIRAGNQIQNLLNISEQLIQECYAFMLDVMVGQELAKYNVDDIPDVLEVRMNLDNRCKAVSDRYQLLKSEMDEYMNLKNGN